LGEYNKKKFIEILEKIKKTYSSLNEMARKSGATSSYLSKIMSFKYEEPPSPKILKGIAENSHDIISYMDLLYICGYIENKDIFEHYNKLFTTENIINSIKESDILNDKEIKKIEESTIYNFYKNINNISEDKKEVFFYNFNNKYNETYTNMIKKVKENIIEESNKIPIIEDFNQDMIIIKNNKIRLNYQGDIKKFTFFSNDYIKKEYDYICIEAKDNSMNFKFNKQDIILIQQQEILKQGDIGFISVNNEQFIRRYRKENEHIILEALTNNENYVTGIYNTKKDKIKILGKVIAYQGKI